MLGLALSDGAMLGRALEVGVELGCLLGDNDGTAEGCLLGTNDGASEGASD
jgi:hypothetical protein